MKHCFLLLFALTLPLLSPAAALQLQDNMFFTLPPNSSACITLTLPDDIGAAATGKQDYIITTSARGWADLTRQVVRTDENSTVVIPICFSTIGRSLGDCSDPYTIRIQSPTAQKEWHGGACVARAQSVNTPAATPNSSAAVRSVISSTINLFDAAFRLPRLTATAGQTVTAEVLITSFASLDYTIAVRQPTQLVSSASTSPFSSSTSRNLSFIAPAAGTYRLLADVNASCTGPSCSKTLEATLLVDSPQSGFDLSLFPQNLNLKTLVPVNYQLTVSNHGPARTIVLSPTFPESLDTTFVGEALVLDQGASKTIPFRVTPRTAQLFYEVVVTASSGALRKHVSSTLTLDELVTDASLVLPAGQLQQFEQQYSTLDSPADLEAYNTLRASLSAAPSPTPSSIPSALPSAQPLVQQSAQPDATLLYLILVAVAGLVVLFILFRSYKRSSGNIQEDL